MPLESAAIRPPLLLTMLPVKIEAFSTKTPTPALVKKPTAEIVPPLVMPPEKLDTEATPGVLVPPTKIPLPDFPVIVPPLLLTIPPAKLSTKPTRIPLNAPVILPLLTIAPPLPGPPTKMDREESPMPMPPATVPPLLMPPVKVETRETVIAKGFAEIVPLLVMPPPNDVVFCTAMPVPSAVPLESTSTAVILPLLETWMPPTITPPLLTSMPTLVARIVPLSTSAP
jgi:hypothetical protein